MTTKPNETYKLRMVDPTHCPDGPAFLGSEWRTPMEAMVAVHLDFLYHQGYGSCQQVECWRFVNGKPCERQWLLLID